jgi:hypothetical protein
MPDPSPKALQYPINLGGPNQPIELFSGRCKVHHLKQEFDAEVQFRLRWLPTPRLEFDIPSVPEGQHLDLGDVSFTLPDGTRCENGLITLSGHAYGELPTAAGVVNKPVLQPADGEAKYASFIVPNFNSPIGTPVEHYKGCYGTSSLRLAGSGWVITMDKGVNHKSIIDRLNANSGFAVTHFGRLERDDGSLFRATEAREVLKGLVVRPENWTNDRRLLCYWLSVQAAELNRLGLSH